MKRIVLLIFLLISGVAAGSYYIGVGDGKELSEPEWHQITFTGNFSAPYALSVDSETILRSGTHLELHQHQHKVIATWILMD